MWSVNVIGIAVVTTSVVQLIWFPLDFPLRALTLAGLALVSGATVLRLPFSASFSVGDAFSFAALFLWQRPGLRVVLMSGYAGEAVADHMLENDTLFLQKPSTARALAKVVRHLLDERVKG